MMANFKSKLGHEDDALLIALYNEGLSCEMIGQKWDVPYRTVARRLHNLGVAFRKAGGGLKGHKKGWKNESVD